MIQNYFIVAWRNILKRPFFALLNIISICTGILFSLLIGIYILGELQVNRQLRQAKNQYFLTSEWRDPNMGIPLTTLGPLAKRLKEEYPTLVANYFRGDYITSIVSKGDKHFRESMDIGDSTLLTMYGFKLLHGDATTALKEPFSVVVKKEIAFKYFGRTNVVGETIQIQNFSNTNHDFRITGVLDDIPENSITDLNNDNHHQLFIPASSSSFFPRADREDWTISSFPSYIELQDGVTAKELELPLKRLIAQNAPDGIKENLTVKPIALTEYYLTKDNSLVKRMLYALSFVGVFILLMAIVNFINISISSSSTRIKEIGIRKVLGGLRNQIIIQFLAESVILVSVATVFALLLYPLAQPVFGNLIGKPIPGLTAFPLFFIAFPTLLILLVGVAAGFYPALRLSALKTSDSIKGKFQTVKENIGLRKVLAGFQFCLAGIVMIAAFIVTEQIAYFFGQSLGYTKDYIVSSQVPRDWSPLGVQKMETVRNEFAAMPEVINVTLSYEIPDGMNGGQGLIYRVEQDSTQAIAAQFMNSDEHFLATYGIPVKAGSFLTAATATDLTKVVINEAAAKAMGWANARDAIGQQVKFSGFAPICTVTGVTGDYHFNSMQHKIPPMVFSHVKVANTYRYLSFKLKPGNTISAISAIEKKWATLLPGSSFEYRFMDDTLKRVYKTEIQLQKASYASVVLSLVIVFLGVIGIVSLSIQKRTKEIGIRKVLGASTSSIMMLFIKDFLGVLIISWIIACPVAWVIMNNWLSNYAYKITLTALPFMGVVVILTLLTVLLIILQTKKAAHADPVKSLKVE
ncbi:ABC transporter permease [Cytophagaceae bacterium YF14B1]|uniref:ABC transporter permease n=1 Tax=Xanthocytophaga flava TaxID=3048013 RepID=A0AAE3QNX3_9BACT|nr:ABC transporter permease [Xanthocytophaga flavus]MDJ1482565.1 ABC transporter permease [Xanthocytophaga flavus]